jgi:divalent metal cation (Fe/Co/Zn/Cd) transporter
MYLRYQVEVAVDHSHVNVDDHDGEHDHGDGPHRHGHGHSHGLVDPSILRSRAGIRAVSISLAVLTATALIQSYMYARTLSVALLADLIHNLGWLASAGVIGFAGNEIAAQIRSRAGRRLESPALIADGSHARVDGFVSLGVLLTAAVVAVGWNVADPLIGLAITLVILKITWDSWHTVRDAPALRDP